MTLPNLNLYARFLLLFTLTTVLLVVLIILGSFALSESEARQIVADRQDALHQMMVDLVQEPIDIEAIRTDAKKNRVDIQITKGAESWATGETLPNLESLEENATPVGQLSFTKVGSRYFIFTHTADATIAVTSNIANLIVYPGWLIYWPWLALVVVLFCSYWLLNKQLKPISEAINSATQISRGNLKHRIANHPKNDLGRLTKGLNDMAENLEQLFASKNDLLLSVSHELRSPMARMKVLLALLSDSETVAKLNKEINKMDGIVEQLLEGERLRDPDRLLSLETYYFPNVLRDIVSSFENAEKIHLEGSVPEIAIEIDLGRFRFLLRNLIENALTHSTQSSPVLVMCSRQDSELVVSVKDFGAGIDEAFLPDVFEPFTQATNTENRSQNGVGLGLFLCKRIVQAHGGELYVSSQPGKGSEFTFRLPIVDGSPNL